MRRSRVVAGGAAVVVLATVAVVVISSAQSGSDTAATSPINSASTVVVERRDLVETASESGTLGYSDSREVVNHLSGYITWLPSEGSLVKRDHALYEVNGNAVILMDGSFPAYRALDSSVSGRDVLQLERNLRALGYDPGHAIEIDQSWTSATTAAVERWQKAHDFTQTGSIELGRVIFQPGTRRIATLDGVVGGSTTGGGGASSDASSSTQGASTPSPGTGGTSQNAAYRPSTEQSTTRAAVYQLGERRAVAVAAGSDTTTTDPTTTDTTTTPAPTSTTPTPTATTPTTTTPKPPQPKRRATAPSKKCTCTQQKTTGQQDSGSEVNARDAPRAGGTEAGRTTPAAGSSPASGGGSTSVAQAPSNVIMTTTSTHQEVTVALDTTKSELAQRGARVRVELPGTRSVSGRVVGVGKVATKTSSSSESSSSDSTATIAVTIDLLSRRTSFHQAPVTVDFEQHRVKNALAIPVTALLARPGGKFAVEVVAGTTRRLVAVTPGIYTSGYVEIDGAGLAPGTRVTNAAIQ